MPRTISFMLILFFLSAVFAPTPAEATDATMAALGDSITQAAGLEGPGDRPECSWAAGDPTQCKVSSHLKRIRESLGRFGIKFHARNRSQ